MIFSASTAALQFAPFPMCTSPWAVILPSKLPKMRADFSKNISPLIVVSAPMTVISGVLAFVLVCVVGICDITESFPIPMEWRAFARFGGRGDRGHTDGLCISAFPIGDEMLVWHPAGVRRPWLGSASSR